MSICRVSNADTNTRCENIQDFERNCHGFYLQRFERRITMLKTRWSAEGKQIVCYVFNFEVTHRGGISRVLDDAEGVQVFCQKKQVSNERKKDEGDKRFFVEIIRIELFLLYELELNPRYLLEMIVKYYKGMKMK